MARFNEVLEKLKAMFKNADEAKKDNIVKSLKTWLKDNRNTEDKGKQQAIQFFLAEINVF